LIAGILLAAGRASRFGSHKLLRALSDGTPVGLAAARNLRRGVDQLRVVVRPGDQELVRLLRAEGIPVTVCAQAELGMGASLAAGVRAEPDARGWVIALADMPWIDPATIRTIADLLRKGADLAAPYYAGRRGHPVGIAQVFKTELLQLSDDHGARDLLDRHPDLLHEFHCDDPGALRDIDVLDDLPR
jgi:molybdenum cofactor cytidylyltransferase